MGSAGEGLRDSPIPVHAVRSARPPTAGRHPIVARSAPHRAGACAPRRADSGGLARHDGLLAPRARVCGALYPAGSALGEIFGGAA